MKVTSRHTLAIVRTYIHTVVFFTPRAVRTAVCVHVCVCVCGRVEATRSLDDSNFGAISCGGGAFAADVLRSTHTGQTWEPAVQLPVGSRRFVAVSYPVRSIEAQQLLCLVGLHLPIPPFHHTHPGTS